MIGIFAISVLMGAAFCSVPFFEAPESAFYYRQVDVYLMWSALAASSILRGKERASICENEIILPNSWAALAFISAE